MGLEARDLSDGPLMEATTIRQNERGAYQFSITLPSGRELISEWVAEDKRREARDPWLSTVRQEMIADAEAVREQARKARQAQAAQTTVTPALVLPTGQASTQSFAASAISPTSTTVPASLASPDEFIRLSLGAAQKDVLYWKGVAEGATAKWLEAQESLQKWTALASALGTKVVVSNESESKESLGSVGSGSRTNRRGRPPGSKNRPKQASSTTSADDGNYDPASGVNRT